MARVTEAEVEAIIDVDSSISATAFITAANLLIDEVLSGEGMDDDYLKEIERWLAAHFVAMRQRQLKAQWLGTAKEEYIGAVGKGLDFTQYGQTVKLLDTSGKLAKVGKPQMGFYAL
jgi:hypothetical protein